MELCCFEAAMFTFNDVYWTVSRRGCSSNDFNRWRLIFYEELFCLSVSVRKLVSWYFQKYGFPLLRVSSSPFFFFVATLRSCNFPCCRSVSPRALPLARSHPGSTTWPLFSWQEARVCQLQLVITELLKCIFVLSSEFSPKVWTHVYESYSRFPKRLPFLALSIRV